MAQRPPVRCRCGGIRRGTECAGCGHTKYREAKRESFRKRGYNYQWDKYSRLYRRRHPLCVSCLNRGVSRASQVVDHIKPHKGDKRLFWDTNNHQALCKSCHDAKTWRESRDHGQTVAINDL